MRKNRIIALCLGGMLCVAASAQAAPLTDFEDWRGSFDLGAWRTEASVDDLFHNDPYETAKMMDLHDGYYYDIPDMDAKWRINGGITHQLSGRWGLQFMHHGMASNKAWEMQSEYPSYENYKAKSIIYEKYGGSVNYTGRTDELNVLYSLQKGVALFAGANRVHNELRLTTNYDGTFKDTFEGTRTLFQGGVIAKAPLSDKVDAFGLVGFGSHSLFQAEAGFAFKMKNDWEANVGYRWFRVKDAFDEYNGHSIDPIGTVKVKGVKFGVTHYFGPAAKKQEPIVTPPVVITPPVVEPPAQPPISDFEKELLEKKKITLKGVNFDFDYDTLQPQGYPILNQVVDVANKYPQWNFLLVGHTDSYGTDEYNVDLSWRRVKTVQRYLVDKGIAEQRLAIDAKGESQPVASNATDEGRAENRRVELFVK